MNRAKKIAKLLETFGESVEVIHNQKTDGAEHFQLMSGRLDIVSQDDCWKVTFVCHGAQSFLCNGVACSALFRKDTGACGDKHMASVLEYENSNKRIEQYTNKKDVLDVFNTIAAVIDLAYANYFPE